jgi:hypothetical protein
MKNVLSFKGWMRLYEQEEVAPKQVTVPGTDSVKKGPPGTDFNSTPSCGPIKIVIFSEPKEDKIEGWQGLRDKPYVLLWADGTVELDGSYSGVNRTLIFRPDSSTDKKGIYLQTGTGDLNWISGGANTMGEAYKVCYYAAKALYGLAYSGNGENSSPMMYAINIKALVLAMKYVKDNYPTNVAKNAMFNNFYANLLKTANYGDAAGLGRALSTAGIAKTGAQGPNVGDTNNVWLGVSRALGKAV